MVLDRLYRLLLLFHIQRDQGGDQSVGLRREGEDRFLKLLHAQLPVNDDRMSTGTVLTDNRQAF